MIDLGYMHKENYAGVWPDSFPSKAENYSLVCFFVEFNINKLPFT